MTRLASHNKLEGLSRAHTSPPTLTFDLPKFNHHYVAKVMTGQVW